VAVAAVPEHLQEEPLHLDREIMAVTQVAVAEPVVVAPVQLVQLMPQEVQEVPVLLHQ
jgi:hypothetical protein